MRDNQRLPNWERRRPAPATLVQLTRFSPKCYKKPLCNVLLSWADYRPARVFFPGAAKPQHFRLEVEACSRDSSRYSAALDFPLKGRGPRSPFCWWYLTFMNATLRRIVEQRTSNHPHTWALRAAHRRTRMQTWLAAVRQLRPLQRPATVIAALVSFSVTERIQPLPSPAAKPRARPACACLIFLRSASWA